MLSDRTFPDNDRDRPDKETPGIIYLSGNAWKCFLITSPAKESYPGKRLFLFWNQEKSVIFPDGNSSKGMHLALPVTRLSDKIYSI
jgi:hypothetical protein